MQVLRCSHSKMFRGHLYKHTSNKLDLEVLLALQTNQDSKTALWKKWDFEKHARDHYKIDTVRPAKCYKMFWDPWFLKDNLPPFHWFCCIVERGHQDHVSPHESNSKGILGDQSFCQTRFDLISSNGRLITVYHAD